MAEEIPYFRFTASEWLTGDISYAEDNLKGVFADIVAFYWSRDCSITQAKLKQCFSKKETEIKQLFSLGVLKESGTNGRVQISFLDRQFTKLSDIRKARQDAGSQGGKQKPSKPQAKKKQKPSYKDKDKYKDKDNIYKEIIKKINSLSGKNYKVSKEFQKQVNGRLS